MALFGKGLGEKDLGYSSLKPTKRAKQMLLQDVQTLQESPWELGLTPAQQEQMISQAQQAAGAQSQAQQAELARQALGSGGFQSGYIKEAARGIAGEAAKAGVAASAQAQAMNQQLIQQRSAEIRASMERQQERARANARYWLERGLTGIAQTALAPGGAGDVVMTGLKNTGLIPG